MELIVAGAGAGKTTELSRKIVETYKNSDKKSNIYCLSYTNNSVKTIYKGVKEILSFVPDNIKIMTIDSFSYQELIKPYYYLLYGVHFNSLAPIEYDGNHKKNNFIRKKYMENGVLPLDIIPREAKYILKDKYSDKKEHRAIRVKIQKQFARTTEHIFVDEAQDICKNVKELLIAINDIKIPLTLIGDPKQDVRGRREFQKLLDLDTNNSIIYKKENYRCPKIHVDFANKYIRDRHQKQYSPKNKTGQLTYSYQKDIQNIENYLTKFDLKYIYQKHTIFITSNDKDRYQKVFIEIKKIISEKSMLDQDNINVLKLSSALTSTIKKKEYMFTDKESFVSYLKTVNLKCKEMTIKFNQSEINKIYKKMKPINPSQNEGMISVNSIQSIKGLQGERCLFIVTNAFMPYLLNKKRDTKMLDLLYVALTRSTCDLELLFVDDVLKRYSISDIESIFEF